jgi:hypothetical protein
VTLRERTTVPIEKGLVGSRALFDVLEKDKNRLILPEFETRTVQPGS